MRVRALDIDHDWTFGAGKSNYVQANAAVVQNINTRLSSFVGNCFFDLGMGIDWFNLLGYKDQLALDLAVSTMILKTPEVTGIIQLFTDLNRKTRNYTVVYNVQTVYSTASSQFVFDTAIG